MTEAEYCDYYHGEDGDRFFASRLTSLERHSQLTLAYIGHRMPLEAGYQASRAAHHGIKELRKRGQWPLCAQCVTGDALDGSLYCAECKQRIEDGPGDDELIAVGGREQYERASDMKRRVG